MEPTAAPISEDAAALASQILGLKKAANANRNPQNKTKKKEFAKPGTSLVLERSFED